MYNKQSFEGWFCCVFILEKQVVVLRVSLHCHCRGKVKRHLSRMQCQSLLIIFPFTKDFPSHPFTIFENVFFLSSSCFIRSSCLIQECTVAGDIGNFVHIWQREGLHIVGTIVNKAGYGTWCYKKNQLDHDHVLYILGPRSI